MHSAFTGYCIVFNSSSEEYFGVTVNNRSIVMDKVLQFTPISAMKAAAKLPLMVLDKLKELDDPWLVAMDRTQQAGRMLAKVLLTCSRQDQSSSGQRYIMKTIIL